jgi:iron-sulfur cluster assembly protein
MMINITEKANKKLVEIADEEGFEKCSVRVMCKGGGCSGMVLDLIFDEIIKETDDLFQVDGIQVIIDQFSQQYLDNIIMDYIEGELGGGGFQFRGGEIKSSFASWNGKAIKIVKASQNDNQHIWGLGEDGCIYCLNDMGWQLCYDKTYMPWIKWMAKEFGHLMVWL